MHLVLILFVSLIVMTAVGVMLYNQLVGLRQMAMNGWADIDVQLKRRADLIPQLVETVKAYAAHENKLFDDVTRRRAEALSAGANPAKRGAAETALSAPVSRLLAIAEDYPELKASENFLELQNQLAETEDNIEHARRFYNGAVRELNTRIETVPANLIAGPFGFQQRAFFELAPSDAALPKLGFDQ